MTRRIGRRPVALLVVALASLTMFASRGGAAEAPVGLGTAESFAILAGSTVTNTGPSVVSGDLGVSPGSAVTGFPPGTVVNGIIHGPDAVATGAQADVNIAYNDAAGRSVSATVSADLGGQTLVSGVYRGSTLALTGTLTLDAQGDPNAVFIFQAGSTLITAPGSRVALVNGASACNVFWQVGSSATLDTNSVFVGTILALTSVTANTGALVTGRLLARNGAVTLDTNQVTRPAGCATTPPLSSTIAADAPLEGLFTLRARLTQTSDGGPIPGRTVVFSTSTGTIGLAVTDANGVAIVNGLGSATQIVLENGYTASFGGDSRFLASSARPTLLAGASGASQQNPAPPPPPAQTTTTTPDTAQERPSGRLPATGNESGMRDLGLVFLVMAVAVARLARRRRTPGSC